jgi:hypothetical protein
MNDFLTSINKLLQRDLALLEKEISLYPDSKLIWLVKGEIKNPAGNLCLHLCGNLQHFIGTVLGNSGYIRQREKEFSIKGLSSKELIEEINKTRKILAETLSHIDPSGLEKEYPIQVFGEPMTVQYFLMHLAGHLNYHLGQVNYHRRLLTNTLV